MSKRSAPSPSGRATSVARAAGSSAASTGSSAFACSSSGKYADGSGAFLGNLAQIERVVRIQPQLRTGEALVLFDRALNVVHWNDAAEELTGLCAEDVVGGPCWQALGGIAPDGSVVCHAGCSAARLAREGWPVPTRELLVRGPRGRRRVSVTTVALLERGTTLLAHLMRPVGGRAAAERDRRAGPPALCRRQRQVLDLLAEGHHAKEIAHRLALSESTVRNHIHALLRRLDSRSQLQALAKARAWNLV